MTLAGAEKRVSGQVQHGYAGFIAGNHLHLQNGSHDLEDGNNGDAAVNGIDFLLIAYILANIIAFLAFAIDKRTAGNLGPRVPERVLLGLAAIGPFGAYLAMKRYRHKTRKTKFVLVPVFLVIHCLVILGLALLYH